MFPVALPRAPLHSARPNVEGNRRADEMWTEDQAVCRRVRLTVRLGRSRRVHLEPGGFEELQDATNFSSSESSSKRERDAIEHRAQVENLNRVTFEGLREQGISFPRLSVAIDLRYWQNIGELPLACRCFYCCEKGFCPLWDDQFSETAPGFAATNHFFFRDTPQFCFGSEAALPTLATNNHYLLRSSEHWVIADNVDIAMVGVLI
jgi:hypothetical protein